MVSFCGLANRDDQRFVILTQKKTASLDSTHNFQCHLISALSTNAKNDAKNKIHPISHRLNGVEIVMNKKYVQNL